MRLALALGVAASAIALAASAQPAPPAAPHVMVMHHGMGMELNVDANNDGWITRAEASGAADRMFAHMDANNDGRLTAEDHQLMHQQMMEGGGHPAWHGEHGETMVMPDDHNCQTNTEDMGQGRRRVTVTCNVPSADTGGSSQDVQRRVVITRTGDSDAPAAAPSAGQQERHSETEVIVRTDGDDEDAPPTPGTPGAPPPPMPPHPPHPPMMMMLFANSEEMDTNHDGAISREEFRAQQLRFFDASDANHDGRIRFEPPPMPPMPPMPPAAEAPPAPPAAPTPPHH